MEEEPCKQEIFKQSYLCIFMSYKLISALILLVFLLASVSAQSIFSIELDSSGTAKITEDNKLIEITSNLTFKQGEIWSFSYSSPGNSLELFLPAGEALGCENIAYIPKQRPEQQEPH